MANTKVVVGKSSVTAGQMKDFWRMVGDGTIGFTEMRDFLGNPRKFAPAQATLVRAINILGTEKVVTAEQIAHAWNVKVMPNVPICYTEDILRQCAQSNLEAGTDFRLVYSQGLSLRELRQVIGTDSSKQPCIYNNDWWMKSVEDTWASEKPEAGYYLIDFNGRFARISWDHQEREIAKLQNFERAHEATVAEAVISIFKTSQKRLLSDWYHWGRSLDSLESRVCVVFFDSNGLYVSGDHPSVDYGGHLRVCLLRKFAN